MTRVQAIGRLVRSGCLASLLIGLAVSAHGQSTKPATTVQPSVEIFVAKLNNAAQAIYANSKNDPALIREGCRNLLNEIVDLNTMAQNSSVKDWDQLTLPEREKLRSGFEYWLIGTCARE